MFIGIGMGILGGGRSVSLEQLAQTWQSGGDGVIGGIPSTRWGTPSTLAGGNTTLLMVHDCIRHTGEINAIKLGIATNGDNNGWKFKVWRWSGATYDLITDQAFTVSGTGTKTITFASPISVQKGDVPSIYCNASNAVQYNATAGAINPSWRYKAGDITVSDPFTSLTAVSLLMECIGTRPYVALIGDSMISYNGGSTNYYRTIYDGTAQARLPAGNVAGEIGTYFGVTGLLWQSLNRDAATISHLAATNGNMDEAVLASPKYIVVHIGTNDISVGTTWVTFEGHLNTIKGKLLAGQVLVVTDISPRTSFNDTQSGTRRTFNADLASWCATNSARFVDTSAVMGKLRVSTGFLDDLLDAYSYDGTHYSVTAGCQKVADLIKTYLS